jgi:purine-binding chemotaxis protein CheW
MPSEPIASPAPGATGTAQDGGHFLTFLLGEALYAVDIRSVREIIQLGAMTAMPLMPAFVRGVINLRGAVVPVIDLHARFGRPRAVAGRKSCIVLVELQRDGERLALGLLVDAVSAVVHLPAAALEAPPEFGAPVRRSFIQAMGRIGERFAVVLAPEAAFDIDEMARLCEAAVTESA